MSVAHALRTTLARARTPIFAALAALAGLAAACAPERVDINVHDIFTGDAARYALQNQMPAASLAQVGGYLPVAAWPAAAAPLLLDLKVVAQNKIDLSSSNIAPGDYNGLRIHWTTLQASAISGSAALSPRPTQVEIYIGPQAATSITDTGVIPLVSGAYPSALLAAVDAGTISTADAGPADAGVDAGTPDAGADAGSSDAGASDAGASDAGGADAGTDAGSGTDAGGGSSDGGAAGQTLVFTSDAELGLAKLVFANKPFALFVVLHMPIDTAANPSMPTGGVDLQFDLQFELAR